MSNIIDELYLRDINPNELMEIKNPCYSKLSKRTYSLSEQLENILDADGKMLFEEFLDMSGSMQALEVRLRFIEGFRLGAKIMLDVHPDISLDFDFLQKPEKTLNA